MLTWASLLLAILQVALKLFTYLQENRLINQGYEKAIAEINAQMLQRSQYAKEVMARINDLSDDDTDKLLHDLEPKQ